jgi:uncharacterized protein
MQYKSAPLFDLMLKLVSDIPVIDCHEHLTGPEARPPYKEPIASLIHGYVLSDLQSASFGISTRQFARLQDPEVPTDEKWPLFDRLWRSIEFTAYARVTKLVLKQVYGQEEMSRAALEKVAERLSDQDENAYFHALDEAGIQLMLVDVLDWLPFEKFIEGSKTFPAKWRPLISLPGMHPTSLNFVTVQRYGRMVDRHITSLEEYLEVVFMIFQRCLELGAVGIKDQSAYSRVLSYDVATRAEAEKQFNLVLKDPRNTLGWPESKALNDFLFHQFMRFARQLDLPVQLHTGHMAGQYNRVDKANAAHLASVLELHQQVRFDLFHGNWPYMGDYLYLGKNYPNTALDLCWLHIIDPAYAIELLVRGVQTVPHTKIHGFGGDYGDVPEFIAAHLQIARQNIAAALAQLVEGRWIEEEDAYRLAVAWLYNNPNRFFKLNLASL